MVSQETLNKGPRSKVLAVAEFGPEIVARNADLINTLDHRFQAQKRKPFSTLDIHLQKVDTLNMFFLADFVEGAGSHRDSRRSAVHRDCIFHP